MKASDKCVVAGCWFGPIDGSDLCEGHSPRSPQEPEAQEAPRQTCGCGRPNGLDGAICQTCHRPIEPYRVAPPAPQQGQPQGDNFDPLHTPDAGEPGQREEPRPVMCGECEMESRTGTGVHGSAGEKCWCPCHGRGDGVPVPRPGYFTPNTCGSKAPLGWERCARAAGHDGTCQSLDGLSGWEKSAAAPGERGAGEPPGAKILSHKWLDPVCIEAGCQSLALRADLERATEEQETASALADQFSRDEVAALARAVRAEDRLRVVTEGLAELEEIWRRSRSPVHNAGANSLSSLLAAARGSAGGQEPKA